MSVSYLAGGGGSTYRGISFLLFVSAVKLTHVLWLPEAGVTSTAEPIDASQEVTSSNKSIKGLLKLRGGIKVRRPYKSLD